MQKNTMMKIRKLFLCQSIDRLLTINDAVCHDVEKCYSLSEL